MQLRSSNLCHSSWDRSSDLPEKKFKMSKNQKKFDFFFFFFLVSFMFFVCFETVSHYV